MIPAQIDLSGGVAALRAMSNAVDAASRSCTNMAKALDCFRLAAEVLHRLYTNRVAEIAAEVLGDRRNMGREEFRVHWQLARLAARGEIPMSGSTCPVGELFRYVDTRGRERVSLITEAWKEGDQWYADIFQGWGLPWPPTEQNLKDLAEHCRWVEEVRGGAVLVRSDG